MPRSHSVWSTTPRSRRRLAAAGGLAAAALLLFTAADASAVSGTVGSAGDQQVTYTFSGADFVLKPGTTHEYTATYAGQPITISGTVSTTVPTGYTSNVAMWAAVGEATADWPGGEPGAVREVSGQTVTLPFSLSYSPGTMDQIRGSFNGGAFGKKCGGVCSTVGASFTVTVPKEAPAPQPAPAPTPAPTGDITPPTVRAYAIGKTLRIGKRTYQELSASDDSGKANLFTLLYDGGTLIGTANSPGLVTAKGERRRVAITPSANRKGPLEFCVWASDAAGNRSARAPKSACKWVDVLVPIKNVSNQCGGAGWDSVVAFQNWIGNTSSFYDNRLDESFPVNFSDACNLHDAGYGGATVRDILDGKRGDRPIRNFRKWSRREVDDKFQSDMKKICLREIPKRARLARYSCRTGTGRYNAVRLVGGAFFDADLRTPGIQSTGHRQNN